MDKKTVNRNTTKSFKLVRFGQMYKTQFQMKMAAKFHFPGLALNAGASSGYFEFLDIPTLSAGIYALRVGETDPQKPHTEDELYYVMDGKSSMIIGDEKIQVRAGDVIYVPAFLEHRFYDISEDLKLLVFFSKAPIKN